MKYLIVVPDGSADDYMDELGGKTPLEVANLPNIDYLASLGEIGTSRNVPEGVGPGSDSANLSVMGYCPKRYLTGRSPLEAAAIGVDMKDTDVSFRVNFVTVDPNGEDDYENFTIRDHAAGDIETEDAKILLDVIAGKYTEDTVHFYPGTGYRHCMIVNEGNVHNHIDYKFVPPHDILDRKIKEYLPKGPSAEFILNMMKGSYDLLKDHPINKERVAKGLNPANSIWIWGQGTKPNLENFNQKFGVDGAVISAVDLIRGIGMFAGMDVIEVEGANGTINTNYEGKVAAAIKEYESGRNMVYMHIEGTDECSHQGNIEAKIRCAEYIDGRVVKPLYEYLKSTGEPFKILVIPDHRTPIAIRTHTSDPVPFVIYDSEHEKEKDTSRKFDERTCGRANNHYEDGSHLADHFFGKC